MKVGIIGLGNMGEAMARNLLKAGHAVTVFNRTRSRAEGLQPAGAIVADTPAQACAGEVVITMLADDHALEQMAFGTKDSEGVVSVLAETGVHISMSTISVSLSDRLTDAHLSKGSGYVAAPVFGRPAAAESKQLNIVAAGCGLFEQLATT